MPQVNELVVACTMLFLQLLDSELVLSLDDHGERLHDSGSGT